MPPESLSGPSRSQPRDSVVTLSLLVALALTSGVALRAMAGEPVLPGQPVPNAPIAIVAPEAKAYLGDGVWRAVEADGACQPSANFQSFAFSAAPQVEVGQGAPGTGEPLAILKAEADGAFVSVETQVCAPVGCNRTVERYKILDRDTMQEWDFQGRLPDAAPYVLVANGKATGDGSAGRVFRRCPV